MKDMVKYVVLLFFVLVGITNALTDYAYYRNINIDNTGNSNTLTDYQVLITLDTATLIGAGKMQSDCDDIRFTESDGTTLLNYWIEDETCNSANTKIWVKVPSIPASSTYTIKLWYGKPTATSGEDISNTFAFGDDFDDASINTSKWDIHDGNVTEYAGYLKLQDTGPAGEIEGQLYNPTSAKGKIYFARYKRVFSSNYIIFKCGFVSYNTSTGTGLVNGLMYHSNPYSGNEHDVVYKYIDSTATTILNPTGTRDTNWHTMKMIFKPDGTLEEYVDGSLKGSVSVSDSIFNLDFSYVKLLGAGSTNYYVLVDWFYIREYTDPEPTTSVGGEYANTNYIPKIFIENIKDGEEYLHSYFNITYYATDFEDDIFTIKVYFDGTLKYENSSYQNATKLVYSTGFLREGTHIIKVYAEDTEGGTNYTEYSFDVEDYEVIDYTYNTYQYEDENYNYTIKVNHNYEIYDVDNVYFEYNNTITIPRRIGPDYNCTFDNNTCGFVVVQGNIDTNNNVLNLYGVKEEYSPQYKFEIYKLLHQNTTFVSFDYDFSVQPQWVEVYLYDSNDNLIVHNSLFSSGHYTYTANNISKIVLKGFDTISGYYGYIDNFYYKTRTIEYYYNITNEIISANSTNVDIEWIYNKNTIIWTGSVHLPVNVNETMYDDTIFLMWRSWLNDIETSDAKSNYWEGSDIDFIVYLSIVLSLKNESGGYCNYDYTLNNYLIKRYYDNNIFTKDDDYYISRSILKATTCNNYYIATESIDTSSEQAEYFNNTISKSKTAYAEYYVINNIRNNETKSLTIWNYDIEKCNSTYDKNLLSITLRREEDYSVDVGNIRTSLVVYDSNGVSVENDYFYDTNLTTQELCLYGGYSSELDYNIDLDGSIYYKTINMSSERSYYLNNASYVGNVIDIDLFTIDTENTDNFLVTFNVKDEFGNNIESAQVKILKLNESTNSYYTLTIVSTDVSGNAYAYLEVEKYYKFVIIYEGIVYYVSNPVQLYQNQYSFVIKLSSEGINPISFLEGVSYDCNVSDDETSVSCFVNDKTNKVVASKLLVYKHNELMKELVYNVNVQSSTTYYNYTIDENKTHSYYFYINIDGYGWFVAKRGVFNDYKRDVFNGQFILESMMIILILGSLSMRNPQLSILLSLVGLVISYLFGFMSLSYPFIISAILIALIVLWRLKQ